MGPNPLLIALLSITFIIIIITFITVMLKTKFRRSGTVENLDILFAALIVLFLCLHVVNIHLETIPGLLFPLVPLGSDITLTFAASLLSNKAARAYAGRKLRWRAAPSVVGDNRVSPPPRPASQQIELKTMNKTRELIVTDFEDIDLEDV
jgi:hypothetical protein